MKSFRKPTEQELEIENLHEENMELRKLISSFLSKLDHEMTEIKLCLDRENPNVKMALDRHFNVMNYQVDVEKSLEALRKN